MDVGSDVDSQCTKCGVTSHVIIAMVGTEIAKVECEIEKAECEIAEAECESSASGYRVITIGGDSGHEMGHSEVAFE